MFTLVWNDDSDSAVTGSRESSSVRHMSTARAQAQGYARAHARPVLILRGETPTVVVMPDGTPRAPEGVKATVCEASEGRACWCMACREERREQRAREALAEAARLCMGCGLPQSACAPSCGARLAGCWER